MEDISRAIRHSGEYAIVMVAGTTMKFLASELKL
jgi:hypothetical protein